MLTPADNFKINLNQNLWGLFVSYGFLGAAEFYELCVLFWFAFAAALIMTISVLFTTIAYTMNYLKGKSGNGAKQ